MKTRMLGKSGLIVSEIGFGSWAIGGVAFRGGVPSGWAGAQMRTSISTIERAWQSGITFFDTADAYGRGKSEVLLGLGLHDHSAQAVIASKVGMSLAAPGQNFSEPYIRGALDASLTRLERAYLDLYLLHCPALGAMSRELFDLMRAIKDSGKIRAWGVSVFRAEEALKAIEGGAEAVQIVYSVIEQDIGNAVFPMARERGVGIIVREALASGWLTGKFDASTCFPPDDQRSRKFPPARIAEFASKISQLGFLAEECGSMSEGALRFVLSEPAVSTVIVGCKSPGQVDANVAAAGRTLSEASLRKARSLFN
ncbi:aldo/keto reductase [Xanthobacteraceae bacterium Astr-EGSB]|uniref:aldo/keto reductase n=1 Tax=Astrobacterium formosum TaxID=3069710 RepID=UPI0027B5465C|nr:aldo/keto reductase [Xanthobacteraceae bacterium Astr-EGSB]